MNREKIIHDDNNGLDYVLVGDYYMPMLALPEENRPIGYWGILRKQYLKKHKSGMYSYLLLTGKLDRYLADLNEQAQERYELIEAQNENCGWSYRETEESESYGMGATV